MYVTKDTNGNIVGLFSNQQFDGQEYVEGAEIHVTTTPLQKIVDIEVANPVTHRMLRDLTLAVAQIASAVTGKAPEENPAVRDIQAMEAQIEGLRQQAKAQGLIP